MILDDSRPPAEAEKAELCTKLGRGLERWRATWAMREIISSIGKIADKSPGR